MGIRKWKLEDAINSKEEAIEMIKAAIEDNDPQFFLKVLGDMARSKGMAEVARELGVSRERLYKSLSEDGNPFFTTVFNALKVLGLSISIKQSSR